MSTTPTEIMETTSALEAAVDVESIKELMDGFDPAALLPELGEVFESLAQVCRFAVMAGPVILLLLGLAYLFLAPKEANYYFGYRCYFGMGSIHAWRFTQRLAGVVLGVLGLGLTLVMFPVTARFSSMAVEEMVWKAVDCLVWEAALALAATLAINLAAALRFDRKGQFRRRKKRK